MKELFDAQQYINEVLNPFFVIWHLQKKETVILCKMAQLHTHTQLMKLSEHSAVCFGK
jgi:hypothetical protein